jgi:hypothetical protein
VHSSGRRRRSGGDGSTSSSSSSSSSNSDSSDSSDSSSDSDASDKTVDEEVQELIPRNEAVCCSDGDKACIRKFAVFMLVLFPIVWMCSMGYLLTYTDKYVELYLFIYLFLH